MKACIFITEGLTAICDAVLTHLLMQSEFWAIQMIPTQIHNQVTDAIPKCEGVFVWDFVIGTLMNYEVY